MYMNMKLHIKVIKIGDRECNLMKIEKLYKIYARTAIIEKFIVFKTIFFGEMKSFTISI